MQDGSKRETMVRAACIGALALIVGAFYIELHEVFLGAGNVAENNPTFGAVGIYFIILFGAMLLQWLRPHCVLKRSELLTIYAMLITFPHRIASVVVEVHWPHDQSCKDRPTGHRAGNAGPLLPPWARVALQSPFCRREGKNHGRDSASRGAAEARTRGHENHGCRVMEGLEEIDAANLHLIPENERARLIIQPSGRWSNPTVLYYLRSYIPWSEWAKPLLLWSLVWVGLFLGMCWLGTIIFRQ